MSWVDELAEIKYSMEIIRSGKKLLLVVPKMPGQDIQEKIRNIVPPEFEVKYQESPKVVTTEALKMLLGQAQATGVELDLKGHDAVVKIEGESPLLTEQDSQIWGAIKNLLKADPFIEGYKVTVNGTVMLEYDPIASKALETTIRPKREIGFSEDDILNLRIELENCTDSAQFIASI